MTQIPIHNRSSLCQTLVRRKNNKKKQTEGNIHPDLKEYEKLHSRTHDDTHHARHTVLNQNLWQAKEKLG